MRAIHLVATAALLIAPTVGAFAADTSAGGGTTEGKAATAAGSGQSQASPSTDAKAPAVTVPTEAATAAGSGQNQASPSTEAKTTVTVQPQGKCPNGQASKAGGGCQP
jgi:hypothetical protein